LSDKNSWDGKFPAVIGQKAGQTTGEPAQTIYDYFLSAISEFNQAELSHYFSKPITLLCGGN